MSHESLTSDQIGGVKASAVVLMLVLVLFALLLVAGAPILDFGNKPLSVAYVVVIYIPIMVVCGLAVRRLTRRLW
jgi:hypothetical protein